MKGILILGAFITVFLTAAYFFIEPAAAPTLNTQDSVQQTNENPAEFNENLGAETFSGTLEEVNTDCFFDGECFVIVDGKHITVLMGWSRDIVGSVQGAEGIGALESHIGAEVEVYAQNKSDDTYTLYGSEEFYIKVQ